MALYDDIVNRLGMFNCELKEGHEGIIQFIIRKVISIINNVTNQNYTEESIPQDLYSIIVDKIAGEYLQLRRITGDLEGFDFTPLVKEIQEGDTKVTYGSSTSTENLIDTAITFLTRARDEELIRYRRLVW